MATSALEANSSRLV